jgi:hypothetical protein
VLSCWPGLERHLGDAADRGQGLATKAESADAEEILGAVQLAGGVAGEGQGQVFRLDAAAVVHHLDEIRAALGHLDVDAPAAGVDRILQQFLEDAGGALDDLAGSDLVDEQGRQALDARQATVPGDRRSTSSEWATHWSSYQARSWLTNLAGAKFVPRSLERA